MHWHHRSSACAVFWRRVNDAKKLGVKIGLGTDVAGGYSPSMLSALRSAVVTSKALRMQHLQPAEHGTEPSPANSHLLDYKVRRRLRQRLFACKAFHQLSLQPQQGRLDCKHLLLLLLLTQHICIGCIGFLLLHYVRLMGTPHSTGCFSPGDGRRRGGSRHPGQRRHICRRQGLRRPAAGAGQRRHLRRVPHGQCRGQVSETLQPRR